MTTNQTIDGVPLLPCPFCGDTPEITKHHREDIYGLIHRCPVAGAISWGFTEDPALHVKRWNRRHVQEQPAPVAVGMPDQKAVSALVTKAARQADLINGANYYTAAELAAEAVIDEVTRLNPSL